MTQEERTKLDIISAYMGSPLTDEQMELASNFTRNTISFSDPGTGKTHTLVAGLLMAQRHHQTPGNKINCISFTKAATSELAGRYTSMCKICSISPTVSFNTLHSFCQQILTDAYHGSMRIVDNDTKRDVEDLADYMKALGIPVNKEDIKDIQHIRKVLRAINSLNSALVFHPANVASRYEFVELGMTVEDFQHLRTDMFIRGLISQNIRVGEIPLYCLYALMKRDDVVKRWKGKYAITVVDEFQDLSLLHLQIMSYVSNTLVVVGDMKQQIYEFNGACPHIVAEYMRMRPDARICNLTKSFRCGQEIADFATKVVKPNDTSIMAFTGHTRGSSVNIEHRKNLNWKDLIGELAEQKRIGGFQGMTNTMFLYRNNASAIPIIEELYKQGLPYRCSHFAKVMDIPIFETLSKLVDAAWHPMDRTKVDVALRCFPEFRNTPFHQETAPVQAMKASGKGFFDISYKYREQSSTEIILAMMQAAKAIQQNKSAGNVYMQLMGVYDKHLYKLEWWKVDNPKEFYFNLVAPICNTKTYPLMYNEELEKDMKNNEAIQARFGIRCYTMHSAKGLEADDIFILDCDEGTFPNSKVMKRKLDAGCYKDTAINIRSERNLLYVAITRAKNSVTISYSGNEITRLISEPDGETYTRWDKYYDKDTIEYNDADEFFKLFKIGEYAHDGDSTE